MRILSILRRRLGTADVRNHLERSLAIERLEDRSLLASTPMLHITSGVEILARSDTQWWVSSPTPNGLNSEARGTTSGSESTALVGDFNGDGIDDIAHRDSAGQWIVATSNGKLFQNEVWTKWSPQVDWLAYVADVDGDGKDDIVGRTPRNSWYVARSTGQNFENERWGKWATEIEWSDVQVADVNGDGMSDVLGRSENGSWWVAVSTGSDFVNQKWGKWSKNVNWSHVETGDFDGDGTDDIVARSENGTWWLAKSLGAHFTNQRWGQWSSKIAWTDVRIADVDANGATDIIGRSANGSWYVSLSTDTGMISEKWGKWSPNIDWSHVQVADFNGDGMDDVVGQSEDGGWWVAYSDGEQFINEKLGKWSQESDWRDVRIGRFSIETPYLQAAVEFLNTLIDHGTDRYGSEANAMFVSLLDLDTLALPDKMPDILPGQRAADRAFPGSNFGQDLVSLMTMYQLSETTGIERYADAADSYVKYFLDNVAPLGNGLFPAGEHAFWNVLEDQINRPTHEDLGLMPEAFLERMWAINSTAVETHIRALQQHIVDPENWYWNRHASITGEEVTDVRAIPRHGGFYMYQWAFLYKKTGDPQLLEWIEKTAKVHYEQRHPVTGLMPYFVEGDVAHGGDSDAVESSTKHMLAMGLSMLQANELLGADALPDLDNIGRAWVQSAIHIPDHDPSSGVVVLRLRADGQPYDGNRAATLGFWDSNYNASGGYGFQGAEQFAIGLLGTYRLTGDVDALNFAQEIWQHYEQLQRPEEVETPGKYAGLIALSLDLHELTGEQKYLNFAQHTAEQAIAELHHQGLFRAAGGASYYEAANGPGELALELVRLHLVKTGQDASIVQRNYWDY